MSSTLHQIIPNVSQPSTPEFGARRPVASRTQYFSTRRLLVLSYSQYFTQDEIPLFGSHAHNNAFETGRAIVPRAVQRGR